MSLGESNRGCLKNTTPFFAKQKREVTLKTELRSETPVVIWTGEGKDMTTIVHSQEMELALRDKALNGRIQRGQDFKEKATAVQIGRVCLSSAYQPLSSRGITALDKYRYDLEDLFAKSPTMNLLIIGDHNVHIGGKEKAPATCGMFGLKTPTNEAGRELLD